MFVCLLVYLLLNAAQGESLSPSEPKSQSLNDTFSSLGEGDTYFTQLYRVKRYSIRFVIAVLSIGNVRITE